MIAAGRSMSRRRSSDQPPAIPSARVRLPARNASSRCVYSISVWYSARGIHEPKHCGQSGHPSPEPVARTTPPHAIRSRMATTVAVARARKVRFMGLRRTMIGGLPGAASGLGYWAPWLRPPPPPSPRSTASHPASTRSFSASSRSAAPRPPRIEPRSTEPIEEIERLVRAGGKRIRPAFCVWGYRAAGGPDVPAIWNAAAALELLHTMALIHDDVMDDDEQRRGEPTVHARQTAVAARRGLARPSWSAPGSPSSPATWRPRSRTSCSRAPGSRRSTGRGGGAVPDDPAGARVWAPISTCPAPRSRRTRSPISKVAPTRSKGRCWWARLWRADRRSWTRRCDATPAPGRGVPAAGRSRRRRRPAGATREDAAALVARARATLGEPLAPEAVVAPRSAGRTGGSL